VLLTEAVGHFDKPKRLTVVRADYIRSHTGAGRRRFIPGDSGRAMRKRKLEALNRRLRAMSQSRWRVSFGEIERITGSSLPASARRHRSWWANDASSPGRQSWAWLDAGYRTVDVDLARGEMTFERSDGRG